MLIAFRKVWFVSILLLLHVGTDRLSAQVEPFAGIMNPGSESVDLPIEVDAESINYDRENGRILASGNVVIASGTDFLRADRVLVHVDSGDLYAIGNVELERAGEIIRGDKLHYNTKTRVSSLDAPKVDTEPFHIIAENIQQTPEKTFLLSKAKITTCELDHDHAHYHVRAGRLRVIPGDHFTAQNAVWYFGRVPVLYMPYWKRRLHDEYGWNFYPGYRSRWGGYLLSSFFHRVNPGLRLEHHVDVYSERGVALGESADWRSVNGKGQLRLYYINDRKPLGNNPPPNPPDVDETRYRIYLKHDHRFDDRTRLLVRNEYVSDTEFRKNFFDRAYRELIQPENYASLSHQRDRFTLTALGNIRINDFYGNVNRIPEVSLNWYRMQMGDSSFYYESQTAAANLQRVFPKGDIREDHSTVRFDTFHSVYQPRRFAGWLNVVPRTRYRATYFSNSRETDLVPNVVVRNVTNELTGVVSGVSETNTTTLVTDGSAQFRQALEIGSELSFKAFKRLADSANGQPWRHLVEPYLDYTFRFEPTVLPEELYSYDEIDRIDKEHQAKIGLRNLLQTKWDGLSVEAADVDVYTVADLDPEEGEDTFREVNMKSRFRPSEWMQIDTDGEYSLTDSELVTLNTRFSLLEEDAWRFSVEHRFLREDVNLDIVTREGSNLVILDTTVSPNADWDFNIYSRYEFEVSRLEEQGGYIQRNYDCMSVRLGGSVFPSFTRTDGTEEEADYRAELIFWLTAFPEMGVDERGR